MAFGSKNRVRVQAQVEGVGQSASELGKFRAAFDRLAGSPGAQTVLQGIGMGAGISAWGLLDSAISKVVDVGAEFVRSAIDEEAGIRKLNQALESNVDGWDGNTDAIEKVIRERERLAFSDDEQRQSLALLSTRTHDVTEALDLQRTAMDLARLRGIELATASEIIGKVHGGNVGILSRYGIAVSKGATATEALAEIQKAAAGQAEAFADTAAGAMQSAQIVIEDVSEDIGELLVPAVKDAAIWVRDDLVPAAQDLGTELEKLGPWIEAFGLGWEIAINKGSSWREAAERDAARVQAIVEEAQAGIAMSWDTGSERVGAALDQTRSKVRVFGGAWDKAADQVDDVTDALGSLEDQLDSALDRMLEATLGPKQLRNELAIAKDVLGENEREIGRVQEKIEKFRDSGKPVGELKDKQRELRGEILEGKEEVIRLTGRLEAMGEIKPGSTQTTIEKLLGKVAALSDEAQDAYYWLDRLNGGTGQAVDPAPRKGPDPRNATGGYIPPGAYGTVGEEGIEAIRMLPGGGAYITPRDQVPAFGGGRSSAPAGGPVVIQLQLDGRTVAEVVDRHLSYLYSGG